MYKTSHEVPIIWTHRKINLAEEHNGGDKIKQALLLDFHCIPSKKQKNEELKKFEIKIKVTKKGNLGITYL